MRLNPDCIRDILLYCEEHSNPPNEVMFNNGEQLTLGKRTYSSDEVFYHLNQCEQNGYFAEKGRMNTWGQYFVRDITLKAHEFLADGVIERPNPHVSYFFARDPDGYRVQFVQG